MAQIKSPTIANPQLTKLSPAERAAKLLAVRQVSQFNSRITPKTLPGTSAAARARAAI